MTVALLPTTVAPPRRPARPTAPARVDKGLAARTEGDLIAAVLEGPEPAVEVLRCAERMAQLPFWERRALGVEGLVTEHAIPRRYAQRLVALWELAERWFPDDRPTIASPHDALLALSSLGDDSAERVVVLLLDSRYHLLAVETVAVGGLNVSRLQPRDVLAPALRFGAAAIIVAHSHPSGDATPSVADRRITRTLREAAAVVGLPLLDHLVVARRAHYSFRRGERWQASPGRPDDDDGY